MFVFYFQLATGIIAGLILLIMLKTSGYKKGNPMMPLWISWGLASLGALLVAFGNMLRNPVLPFFGGISGFIALFLIGLFSDILRGEKVTNLNFGIGAGLLMATIVAAWFSFSGAANYALVETGDYLPVFTGPVTMIFQALLTIYMGINYGHATWLLVKETQSTELNTYAWILFLGLMLGVVIGPSVILVLTPLQGTTLTVGQVGAIKSLVNYILTAPTIVSQGYVLISRPLIVYALSAKLKKLIIATMTGLPIYSYDFIPSSQGNMELSLTSAALSGVISILQEIMLTRSNLEEIRFTEGVLLNTTNQGFVVLLIVEKATYSIRRDLKNFTDRVYTNYLKDIDPRLPSLHEKQASLNALIRDIFPYAFLKTDSAK